MTGRSAPPTPSRSVTVHTAAHTYECVVQAGALEWLPQLLREHAPAARYAIIADSNVAALYGKVILDRMRGAGAAADLLSFPAGETGKTRESWSALTDRLVELEHGRDSCIIALGGGVTGDLAGFVAATFMRGVQLAQVPTTLLAMIDAAVGGKTGVDTPAGKNLVGAFHAPAIVIADPLVLSSLPPSEVSAGLAEAVKHGAILDAPYFEWIGRQAAALRSLDPPLVEQLVSRSVQLKARVVAEDPLESGYRAVLNFGHTVAHALEHCTRYALPHGRAVAIGMVAEARLGEAMHVTREGTAARIAATLAACDLPTATVADADALVAAMRLDKKARDATPRFTLLSQIGACARDADDNWTHAAPADVLDRALREVILDGSAV